MTDHRPPDIVGPPSLPWAQWPVPTDGPGADSRVVLTQIDNRWRQRSRGAPVLMIRAEKLPQSDVPALLEAIAAAGAYSFDPPPESSRAATGTTP